MELTDHHNLNPTSTDTGPGAIQAMELLDHQGSLELESHCDRPGPQAIKAMELIDHHGRLELRPNLPFDAVKAL